MSSGVNALRGFPRTRRSIAGHVGLTAGSTLAGTPWRAFATEAQLPLLRLAQGFRNLHGRSRAFRSCPGLVCVAARPKSPGRQDHGRSQQTTAKYQRRHRLCSNSTLRGIRTLFSPYGDGVQLISAAPSGESPQDATGSARYGVGLQADYFCPPSTRSRRQTIPRLRAVRCQTVLVIRSPPPGRNEEKR